MNDLKLFALDMNEWRKCYVG